MKIAVITHVAHLKRGNHYYAYSPYVTEMNLWLSNADEVQLIAPLSNNSVSSIHASYNHQLIHLKEIPNFNWLNWNTKITSIQPIITTVINLYKAMRWADHIHVRCPGNVGLLGTIVQIAFPQKRKTVKYAGNWDPNSKQPWSYRLQQWILSNTLLSKNIQVLVYGNWPRQSKNIVPFYTASYHASAITPIAPLSLNFPLQFIYAGTLTANKRVLLSLQVVEQLKKKGHRVQFHIYGDGPERSTLENFILDTNLQDCVQLYGNVTKETLLTAYQKSHFLLFFSQSEGWPKTVAEAMFWGCLPITTPVSCVPMMLDKGHRGSLVLPDVTTIVASIESYLTNETLYQQKVKAASQWSQQFTLEKMETEIQKLLE